MTSFLERNHWNDEWHYNRLYVKEIVVYECMLYITTTLLISLLHIMTDAFKRLEQNLKQGLATLNKKTRQETKMLLQFTEISRNHNCKLLQTRDTKYTAV